MSAAAPAEPVITLENANGTTEHNPTPTIPKAKLSAITRFKALTSSGFRSSSETAPSFPPTSWSLSQSPESGSGASSWAGDVEKWRLELERWKEQMKTGLYKSTPPTTPGESSTSQPEVADDASAPGSKGKDSADPPEDGGPDASEPSTLAMRIKAMIDESLNFSSAPKTPASTGSHSDPGTPGPSTSSTSQSTPSGSVTPKSETTATTGGNSNGSMFNFGVDSKLAKLLSSESIMNGGAEKGRESVWAILDRMGYRKKDEKGKEKDDKPNPNEIEEDGIMFYSPLQPTTELSPEIAESVLEDNDNASYHPGVSPPTSPHDETTGLQQPPGGDPATRPKQKRVFQPSATQLSFQCTWWGYRLFIPPPIMAQLSNAHIAAAKRGAMIAAALKWVVDKAPVMMIPPPLRPAMTLLKAFSPYLGYVGAFVAWSWGRIESKDTGTGVVLTATWLLPIAILPSSWDFEAHGVPVDPATSGGETSSTQTPANGVSSSVTAATSDTRPKDVKENADKKEGAPLAPSGTSTGVSVTKGKTPVRGDSTISPVTRREPRISRTTSAPTSSSVGRATSYQSPMPSVVRSPSDRTTPMADGQSPRPRGILKRTSDFPTSPSSSRSPKKANTVSTEKLPAPMSGAKGKAATEGQPSKSTGKSILRKVLKTSDVNSTPSSNKSGQTPPPSTAVRSPVGEQTEITSPNGGRSMTDWR
ncbi:hypothetical protein V5O48_005113 [Marasmius crinis-equi]|uniref:Uncharacterized protein n=1 Tax=Marasmius crinis-equi TaxID=585013 RepID=A0ABR3FN79_9AGAR